MEGKATPNLPEGNRAVMAALPAESFYQACCVARYLARKFDGVDTPENHVVRSHGIRSCERRAESESTAILC